jgi:hypothetical protein
LCIHDHRECIHTKNEEKAVGKEGDKGQNEMNWLISEREREKEREGGRERETRREGERERLG